MRKLRARYMHVRLEYFQIQIVLCTASDTYGPRALIVGKKTIPFELTHINNSEEVCSEKTVTFKTH